MRILIAALIVAGVASQAAAQAPPPDLTNPPADAVKTASGLITTVLAPGTSAEKAGPVDVVSISYTGWTNEGRVFDSSASRTGGVAMFPLNRSMAGLRECVGLMVIGERRRCWVPESLAYRGAANRPRGTLVFDVQLVDRRMTPTVAPADVKEPPSDARRTANGIAYKVLREGTGTRNPSGFSRVTVHYSGWTTDGKLFDSSVSRGQPATFELGSGVIRGWTEGVQLMVEGERARLWIPQDLAYKGEPGNPRGMLVFDIDLIKIE